MASRNINFSAGHCWNLCLVLYILKMVQIDSIVATPRITNISQSLNFRVNGVFNLDAHTASMNPITHRKVLLKIFFMVFETFRDSAFKIYFTESL